MGQPKDSEFKDRDTMTLDLDDGGKLECIVLNVFPILFPFICFRLLRNGFFR